MRQMNETAYPRSSKVLRDISRSHERPSNTSTINAVGSTKHKGLGINNSLTVGII
jgi:hypothetical protein